MYRVERFKDHNGTKWFVSEMGHGIYLGVDKSDCERYLAGLLSQPSVRERNA